MNTTVEILDGLNRRLTLNPDMVAIEAEVGKRLAQVGRTVRIDGFRPGKAPKHMIAARYGNEIRNEVFGQAIQEEFQNAIASNHLRVAGNPNFTAGENGSISVTFEVIPEIQLGDLSQIKVIRPIVELTDANIDNTLNILRKQRIQFHLVEREAKEGDRIHVDFIGQVDAATFPGGEGKDFPIILGEGRTFKDFENALIGMKAGENKTFDVTFPEDYFAKELANKTANFNVTAISVYEGTIPEIDAEFAHNLGIADGNVEHLREEIRVNILRETKNRVLAKIKEQAFNGLLETSPIELPASLVAMECAALKEKALANAKARGVEESNIKLNNEMFEPQAMRRVSLGLIMDALILQHNIGAPDDAVRSMVSDYAQNYENPSDVVNWYYQDATRLQDIKALVLEENIVNWLLGHAQVSDEVTTIEALMGNI